MTTYHVWFDGDDPEDAVEVHDPDVGLAVEHAADLLYNDSAGEGFDAHGMKATILHVKDVGTGETEKWKVTVEFSPHFYASKT